MGMFGGGGFFGSGGKTSQTVNTQSTNTEQFNAGENEGVILSHANNNQITYTDHGAVSEASALAQMAVQAGMEQSLLGAELSFRTSELFSEQSNRALESVQDFSYRFGDAAFSTVERALGQVGLSSENALEFGALSFDFGSRAFDMSSDATRDALQFGANALSESAAARQDALAATSGAQRNALEAVVSVLGDSFTSVTNFMKDLQGQSQEQIGDTVTALNTISREQNKSTDERVAEVAQSSMKMIVIGLGVLVVGFGLVFAFKK